MSILQKKKCNGGFEENIASLNLLVLFLQDAKKRHFHCILVLLLYIILLNILVNILNIFYSCNLTFHTFSRKDVSTFSIKAFVSDFYISFHLILLDSCRKPYPEQWHLPYSFAIHGIFAFISGCQAEELEHIFLICILPVYFTSSGNQFLFSPGQRRTGPDFWNSVAKAAPPCSK